MRNSLYRQEAVDYKRCHWKGKVLLITGLPASLIVFLSSLFIVLISGALFFCHYTQRIDVRGEVITLPNSINVFSPQPGVIVRQWAKPGDRISKGDFLYELDVSRSTTAGKVSEATIQSINEKIANANEIILKLIRNKEETHESLKNQSRHFEAALQDTTGMLEHSLRGLNKMRASLANYDGYLKMGLINKDQYNYQHSLFFQQQSSYQSLASQKMQIESQLTQIKSDIVTKLADFDNQISSYKNQINDYKSQLIESNANDSLIVKATSDGIVESLSVTVGRMVDKGSSLAQIKPIGKVDYYLVLWLPNNSLPYVKKGDPVNIRYDAFPAEKFGQFSGVIAEISSVPATRQEMSEYNNTNSTNVEGTAYYKALVSIKQKHFNYKGKKLHISSGLIAHTIVFLEERPLYMWMFSPVYNIAQSVSGPLK